MTDTIIWLVAAAAVSTAIWFLPQYLDSVARRQEIVGAMCEAFYQHAGKIADDPKTPEQIISMLEFMSRNLGDARYVKRIVWNGLKGKLRKDAEDPPQDVRNLLQVINDLSGDQKRHFVGAVRSSLLASAANAGLPGEVFVRIMLFSPEKQEELTTFIGAEQFAGRNGSLAAA